MRMRLGEIGWGEERGLGMTAVCSDAVSSCDLQEECHMIRSTAQTHYVHIHIHTYSCTKTSTHQGLGNTLVLT